ncbi:MAG: hypothetical protein MJD61_11345 [Proteobacteria bacterium]|nr:hypothetical protein [Pseudomonadota bacterium]
MPHGLTSRLIWLGGLGGALCLAGCLGTTFRIKHDELHRLASALPQQRGQRVRVLQRFGVEGRPRPAPAVGVYPSTVVVVDAGSPPARGAGAAVQSVASKAEAAEESAKALTVLAVLGAVGLAAAEGPRYDGWVELHQDHPVHLLQRNGAWFWVPLSKLDPATIANVQEAVVVQGEGPWRPLGRAPLDRKGFTYGVELGGAGLASMDGKAYPGFSTRIQFGGFPSQHIGLIVNLGYGWGDNGQRQTLVNQRVNLELHGYAPALGRAHLGGYLQAGLLRRVEDQALGRSRSGQDPIFGGGVLAQLELTTRLALTGRVGLASISGTRGQTRASEYSLGVSIY